MVQKYNNRIWYLVAVTDLKILMVLITELLRRDFNRLINKIEPVEL
jgi:hypothetical protein